MPLLLFVEQSQVEIVRQTITHYALMEDGDEKGAAENRCDFKLIDPKKGSAAGYIAKYVSKNIDGEHLDKGVYGENPTIAAQRVDAWASCWCIRQFQQIGGASVTIWRELRRLKESFAKDSILENSSIIIISLFLIQGNLTCLYYQVNWGILAQFFDC